MSPSEIALAKFWSRVKIPTHSHWKGHCWGWLGAVTSDVPRVEGGGWGGGYGCLTVDNVWWRAHRYIWTLIYGEIPEDRVIGHTCDNRLCVNPSHLELITQSENTKHSWERTRNKEEEVPF